MARTVVKHQPATQLELIKAHQLALNIIHSNYTAYSTEYPQGIASVTTVDMGQGYEHFLSPETPWGLSTLKMISRAWGRPVTEENILEVAVYLAGE